ncbi:MAG: GNAT family N-acetyltransferase [Methyloprofundus sp.]|nr:GNAT family N-acetyltransferase [Methyloprofundus sp.]
MEPQNYSIRTMTGHDVKTAIEWAAAEGWNPGLQDAESFYAADPKGFLIGEIAGEAVAVLSAVKYGKTFGFMGLYIVNPKYRGKGYGMQLWNAGIAYLAGRNIGLDGVLEQQHNYKKSGFKLAYRNIRYKGINTSHTVANESPITDLASLPFELIQSYDRTLFPEQRALFLTSWIKQPNHHALGLMQGKTLAGYGVIRKCQEGYKIGPLFADSTAQAESLFQALRSQADTSAALYLDVPETNKAAISLAEKYNMQPVFETARMYTQQAPKISMQKLFGVTSFELG